MSSIDHVRHLHPRRPQREAPRLWRHAARRSRRVRPAQGSRRGTRGAARGGRAAASITSTPAISTVRTSPTRSSAKRCIPIPTISSSSPRSAPGAARTDHGFRPSSPEELTQRGPRQSPQSRRRCARRRQPAHACSSVHGPAEGSIEAPLTVLAELQQQGLVRHIGLEQRHADADRRRPPDLRDRLRAEPLQSGASRRRRADRRSCPRRHRLCAVLPARDHRFAISTLIAVHQCRS